MRNFDLLQLSEIEATLERIVNICRIALDRKD